MIKKNGTTKIILFPHKGAGRFGREVEPRPILPYYPVTVPFAFILDEIDGSWFYTAGNGSNITHLKNPYLKVSLVMHKGLSE